MNSQTDMESEESGDDDMSMMLSCPTKKKKFSNFDKCIVCQENTTEPLRSAKQASVKTLISALDILRNDVYDRLCQEIHKLDENTVKWHSKCYERVTNKKRLQTIQPARLDDVVVSQSTEQEKYTRSKSEISTATDTCLFCKKKTHKKVKELINVTTFSACESVRKAAEAVNDEEMLHFLRGVNDDLMAAEIKYHKACHASYISKRNISFKTADDGTENIFSKAFSTLAQNIKGKIECGKAYEMSKLLAMFLDILESKDIPSASYTAQKLKRRLIKEFGDQIVFYQPQERTKSEVVFSSKVSICDVINTAFQLTKQNDDSESYVQMDSPAAKSAMHDIYNAASRIRQDVKKSDGIQIKPLSHVDLSLVAGRNIIPDSLYWLLRWMLSSDDKDNISMEGTVCDNDAVERQVIILGQDIMHCMSKGRIKTPKHAALGMSVRHLTGSKTLITILNRMGHSLCYDDIEVIDTSLAREVIAQSATYGVVIPSNMQSGAFVQAAGDNDDINEETLDGKNTTHAATVVMYQPTVFGPKMKPEVLADHSVRTRKLDNPASLHHILEFYAQGKRPNVDFYVDSVDRAWFTANHMILSQARKMDITYLILRNMVGDVLEDKLDSRTPEKQHVPSWSGFYSILYPDAVVKTTIGYCPMINKSTTEFSTVYTMMKQVAQTATSLGQKEGVVTFDLAIYVKAKEIQWRRPLEFADMVVRMGGFHIVLNFLSVIGKMFDSSGLDDLWLESGLYGTTTSSAILKGKCYNRGIRAHKLTSEAFFRLQWQQFSQWIHEREPRDDQHISESIKACQDTMENQANIQEAFKQVIEDVEPLHNLYLTFLDDACSKSETFAFWQQYQNMVSIMLQFVKAERQGNWKLHLSSTAALVPYFFAMDRQNYSRWLPVYLADMHMLETKHPYVYSEFMLGNHAVKRSCKPFASVWTDMALEQSINRDSKSKGGVIGISQKEGALDRWFLTSHHRAEITTALKQMCDIQDSDRVGTHKEAGTQRVKRDEADIQNLLEALTSDNMSNPFSLNEFVEDKLPLQNFVSGVIMPQKFSERLVTAREMGKAQMDDFIADRLSSNQVKFWDPLPNLKIKTFSSLQTKTNIKISEEKEVTITTDRDLFGRLLIVAKSRAINLKEVFSYELSPIPLALAHLDGSLRKTEKSQLLSFLEKKATSFAMLPDEGEEVCYIIDAMAQVQAVKAGQCSTFGELAALHYQIVAGHLGKDKCSRVDIVFDKYEEKSIKNAERSRRNEHPSTPEIKIQAKGTKIPKQWLKYISNQQNKINLSQFLSENIIDMGKESLQDEQAIVVAGGLSDPLRAVKVTKGLSTDIEELYSNQEEADTRILLHAKHSSLTHPRVVVSCQDTDVAVMCLHFASSLQNCQIWFRTGVKDRLRYIPMHILANTLGETVCSALPSIHAISGCDTVSSFPRISKKKAYETAIHQPTHLQALSDMGSSAGVDDILVAALEQFVCSLYTNDIKAGTTCDSVRYYLFCQKQSKNEKLPPTSDCIRLHIARANYQSHVWKASMDAIQQLPDPTEYGWTEKNGHLTALFMTKEPAPKSILELVACGCKTSLCRRRDCKCQQYGLPCTESCTCMGDELCANPHSHAQVMDEGNDWE